MGNFRGFEFVNAVSTSKIVKKEEIQVATALPEGNNQRKQRISVHIFDAASQGTQNHAICHALRLVFEKFFEHGIIRCIEFCDRLGTPAKDASHNSMRWIYA